MIEKIEDKNFDTLIYIYKYDEIIRKKLLDYKFDAKSYLYRTFADEIKKNEKICRLLQSYDIIIPVPIHKNRRLERGYNQSELIAKELRKGKECRDMPNVLSNILIKHRNTEPQSVLNKEKRTNNIKDAYKVADSTKIKDRRILLLDDIYTTGSTVNECSRILKQSGANSIDVLVVAKD